MAQNRKGIRRGKMIGKQDVSEKEHHTLNILIQDGDNRTSVLRYFKKESEKEAFINYIHGGAFK